MKNMKKLLALVLIVAVVFTFAACGSSDSSDEEEATTETEEVEEDEDEDEAEATSYPEYNWNAANVLAEDSVYAVALHEFADLIEEKSDGAITIDVYDNGTLGAEKECMEGLQMGTVDFWVGSSATASNFTNSQVIYDLPYLFENSDIARTVLQGDTCQEILGELSDVGMKGLGYFENGIYAIISKDPIRGLDDMKGLKIRSIESNLQADTYAALGATGVVIAWGDCYTSLQTGVCDAISSTTVPNMESAKFYEIGKYITRSNHGYSPCLFAMSQDLWDSLEESVQDLIMECTAEAIQYQYDYIDDMMNTLQDELEGEGVEFIDIDTGEWAAACDSIYDKYVGDGDDQVDPDKVERIQSEIAGL